ncbi:hypothetical protein [Streptomyces sp. NPDC001537]
MKNVHTIDSEAVPRVVADSGTEVAHARTPGHESDEARSRLKSLADRYFDALLSHSPAELPLDPQVRMTENTIAIPMGEGVLWRALTKAPEGFRVDVVDAVSEQIVVGGLLEVRGRPYLAGIRLRVLKGRIIEVEHLHTDMIQPAAWANLERPRDALVQDVPLEQRNDRVELQLIADSYFDALTSEDSRRAPSAADCVRHETGLRTTGNSTPPQLLLPQNTPADERERMQILMDGMSVRSAAEQIDSGLFADLWKVWPRRPIVIDEVKGLVAAFPLFIQNGDVRSAPLTGYPGVDRLTNPLPFSTQWLEIFKIHSGRIHEIEAPVFVPLNFGAGNGWDSGSGL